MVYWILSTLYFPRFFEKISQAYYSDKKHFFSFSLKALYLVYTRTIFVWNISLWNEVIFWENCIWKPKQKQCNRWFKLLHCTIKIMDDVFTHWKMCVVFYYFLLTLRFCYIMFIVNHSKHEHSLSVTFYQRYHQSM